MASFMSQTNMISNPSKGESKNSTHPSMLIRCRSLLWFAMSVHSIEDLDRPTQEAIHQIDSRVVKDLEKFVDGQVRLRKTEFERHIGVEVCTTDLSLWFIHERSSTTTSGHPR